MQGLEPVLNKAVFARPITSDVPIKESSQLMTSGKCRFFFDCPDIVVADESSISPNARDSCAVLGINLVGFRPRQIPVFEGETLGTAQVVSLAGHRRAGK